MNNEELKEKYKDILEESTIQNVKELCDKGILNFNSNPSKIWVCSFLKNDPYEQAQFMLNSLVNNECALIYDAIPVDLFEKIYAVKDYKNFQDIIIVFKDDIIDEPLMNQIYSATIDNFRLDNYLQQQLELSGTYVKETFDPLNYNETNEKLEKLVSDLESEDENIKSQAVKDLLEGIGLIGEPDDKEKDSDINYEKVNDIKIGYLTGKITNDQLREMAINDEITIKELKLIILPPIEIKERKIDKRVSLKTTKIELLTQLYNWVEGEEFTPLELDEKINAVFNPLKINKERIINEILKDNEQVKKDLQKVEFDIKNVTIDSISNKNSACIENTFIKTLDNGFSYVGLLSNNDNEYPVYFILYWDGTMLRGYVPEEGNIFNKLTYEAVGHDKLSDYMYILSELDDNKYKEFIIDLLIEKIDMIKLVTNMHPELNEIEQDIKNNIEII